MKLKMILFDLDGTLLPMDQDEFVKCYFGHLAKKLAPLGYEPKSLIDGIWAGTAAMIKNDGKSFNEEAFWKTFSSIFGEKVYGDMGTFEEFYREDFCRAKEACGFNCKAAESVRELKKLGYRVALATNPIFPAIATEQRIRWAGLEPEDFEMYTTYENSTCCKPNPDYYREVLKKLSCKAEECMMVGNDVGEDMIAEKLGMKVFLLTDCLINRHGEDTAKYPHGSFDELMAYIKE